ncbi:phage tail protein [Aliikangiella marina]|uniref:Phage tail protein n=1 Tax=Aliikangiella marina TaxID=1712262 RepID=A0A545T2R3_9GAMM|nr:phage tail protein [Aliikangiella marina]TQV71500.1 phage tail protein [Aliikangiella marina]
MAEFIPFRFEVNLYEENQEQLLCRGLFSEVSGLEITMEPRAIQVGGQNWGEVQRVGQTRFSPIVLKRGVTELDDLWKWFDATTRGSNYGYRLQGNINILGSEVNDDGEAQPVMTWNMSGVLPTRFKGPDLSSTANQVAIEEVTLVLESLTLERPGG